MKISRLGLLISATSLAVLVMPLSAQAQTAQQIQNCRKFVGYALEMFNPGTVNGIQVGSSGVTSGGEVSLNWRLTDGSVTGTCVVGPRGQVLEYRRDRRNIGGGGTVDYSWGREVTPYSVQLVSGGRRDLLNRPQLQDGRVVGSLNTGERVTVLRTYSDTGNTWLLVRNNYGQEGWLQYDDQTGGNSGSGNYGNNPAVDYKWGQDVRPFTARVVLGSSIGEIVFGSAGYELLSRPTTGQNQGNPVGLVKGGEQVTVYRSYSEGNPTWLLVKGARGQEGWLPAQRLSQF